MSVNHGTHPLVPAHVLGTTSYSNYNCWLLDSQVSVLRISKLPLSLETVYPHILLHPLDADQYKERCTTIPTPSNLQICAWEHVCIPLCSHFRRDIEQAIGTIVPRQCYVSNIHTRLLILSDSAIQRSTRSGLTSSSRTLQHPKVRPRIAIVTSPSVGSGVQVVNHNTFHTVDCCREATEGSCNVMNDSTGRRQPDRKRWEQQSIGQSETFSGGSSLASPSPAEPNMLATPGQTHPNISATFPVFSSRDSLSSGSTQQPGQTYLFNYVRSSSSSTHHQEHAVASNESTPGNSFSGAVTVGARNRQATHWQLEQQPATSHGSLSNATVTQPIHGSIHRSLKRDREAYEQR